MSRPSPTLAAAFILGAATVLAVQALRRHRPNRSQGDCDLSLAADVNLVDIGTAGPDVKPLNIAEPPATSREVPERSAYEATVVDPLPVADVPPARNGDRPPTPNLDRILAERAAEQRDDSD